MRVRVMFRKRGDRLEKHKVVIYCNRKFLECKNWCYKVVPTEEYLNANGWEKPVWNTSSRKSDHFLFGPASCMKSKMIFYPCEMKCCWIGCPCLLCRGVSVTSKDALELFKDHQQYHHARHISCEFCIEIFKIIPAYSYDGFIDVYGEFPLRGVVRSMKSIPHKSFVFYHNTRIIKVSNVLQLQCDECDQVFTKKKNKYRHMRTVHLKSRIYDCDLCEKSFDRSDTVKKHRIEVHDPDPEEDRSACNHCGDDENQPEIPCKKCNEDFCKSRQLKKHEKTDHLECIICSQTFSRKVYLQAHISRVKAVCSTCSLSFCNKRQLILHKVDCGGEKYFCEECDQTFKTESNKRRHIKATHERDKTFQCEECNKGFDRSDVLMKHRIQVHDTVPISFSCDNCQTTFTKYESWLKHVEANFDDKGQPLNGCTECQIDFCNVRQLKQHMNKSHLECTDCKQQFSKKSNLTTHVKKAKVVCQFCSKEFCNTKQLFLHKKSLHRKEVQCEICELYFDQREKMERHMIVHN